jgi:UDP-glucose 4-epimerase
VLDASALTPLFRGADAIFHLVAHSHDLKSLDDTAIQAAVTLGSTVAALRATERAGVGQFIFASSVAVHGPVGASHANEDFPCNPATPYGRAKLAAEDAVREFAMRAGTLAACIRPPMMYGVGCRGNLPRMIRAVATRTFPPIPEFGNRRSLVAVDDVAAGMVLAWQSRVGGGRPFIVTDGEAYSTRQMLEHIRRALGREGRIPQLPAGIFSAAARLGDVAGSLLGRRVGFDSEALARLAGSAYFDSRRAERELGFAPTMKLADALPPMIRDITKATR